MIRNKIKSKEEYKKLAENFVSKLSTRCPNNHLGHKKSKKCEFNFRCRNKYCMINYNILENTPFKGAKLKLWKIIKIYDCWLYGMNVKDISFILKLNKNTVTRCLRNLEICIADKYYNSVEPLGGGNIIVEIDESKFGKVKYHRGHRVEGVWVFGMIERTEKRRIIVMPVPDRKKETLTAMLLKYVKRNSIIYSDSFSSYGSIKEFFSGHKKVNHSLHFVDPVTKVHTNTIEGNWNGIKLTLPIRKRTKKLIVLELIRFMIKRENPNDFLDKLLSYLE
ncbi:hypothetical protein H311_00606 [Anncaliia algerae PRA109]|nr:hypothetical protein H311_00606 [Anncaliia algerae PRA109]